MSEQAIRAEVLPGDELVETAPNGGPPLGTALALLPPADQSLPKPWDKQPWESIVSYRRFVEHYLSQEPPRSVLKAYRQYRQQIGGNQAEISAIRRVSGVWHNWAYARTYKGEPIAGALTWAQRGRAFDVDQAQTMMREEENLWAERRRNLRHMEWDAGVALLERGKRMMSGLLFRKMTEETISKDGQTIVQQTVYEPTDWGEREVMATFKVASELLRRGAGEPPNNVLIRDWEAQARQAGINPEALRDAVHRALLEQEMDPSDVEDR